MKKKSRWVLMCFAIMSMYLFASCESDEARYLRQLNEVIGNTNILVPVGDFVFDENSPRTYLMVGKLELTLDMLNTLKEKGVIDVRILEQAGRIYRVQVDMTEEGEKYQLTEPERIGGTSFIYVAAYKEKAKEITNMKINELAKKAECYYSTEYSEVTPFGEVFLNVKNGEATGKESSRSFVWDEEEKSWVPRVY